MTVQTQPRKNIFKKIANNPITVKELRSRMRGRRAFVVLTLYLLGMGTIIAIVYAAYAAAATTRYGPDVREAGKSVFAVVIGVEAILVMFIGPSFTAGAISGERERQTFDLLRTTLLTPGELVAGKLWSALSYVLLLIVASIPLQSIAFFLGGLSWEELLIGQLLITVAALAYAMFGLYCSSVMKSTLSASVMTFGGGLFWTFGLPAFTAFAIGFISSFYYSSFSSLSWTVEALLMYGLIVLVSFNFPGTIIASELILLEENAIFGFSETFSSASGSHSVWIISPWLLFIPIYLLLTLFFYWRCVKRVQKIADQ